MIVRPSSESHWYSQTGDPVHEVPNASKPGEMRNTTIMDARKLRLFGSVTNILGIKSKPTLEAWKQSQAILSSLTLPRLAEEADEDFAKRVVKDMGAQAKDAAKRGHQIHAHCEQHVKSGEVAPELAPFVQPFASWLAEYLEHNGGKARSEVRVVGDGYAGTADLIIDYEGFFDIADVKTQDWRLGRASGKYECRMYIEWLYQLRGYAMAYERMTGKSARNYISLCIDKSDPEPKPLSRFESRIWRETEIARASKAFPAALDLWCADNDYDPREKIGAAA